MSQNAEQKVRNKNTQQRKVCACVCVIMIMFLCPVLVCLTPDPRQTSTIHCRYGFNHVEQRRHPDTCQTSTKLNMASPDVNKIYTITSLTSVPRLFHCPKGFRFLTLIRLFGSRRLVQLSVIGSSALPIRLLQFLCGWPDRRRGSPHQLTGSSSMCFVLMEARCIPISSARSVNFPQYHVRCQGCQRCSNHKDGNHPDDELHLRNSSR